MSMVSSQSQNSLFIMCEVRRTEIRTRDHHWETIQRHQSLRRAYLPLIDRGCVEGFFEVNLDNNRLASEQESIC